MKKFFYNFLFLIVATMVQPSWADEYREFYNNVRSLGMGGVSVAIVNDETALLVNPAALGKVRDFYGTLLDPEIDITSNYWDIYRTQAFSNANSISAMQPTLSQSLNKYFHSRYQVFPSVVVRNFGIGVFYKNQLDAEHLSATEYKVNYYNDAAFIIGYSFRFWDGRIKFGFNTKLLARVEVDKTLDPAVDSLELKDQASEGVGLGIDSGLILTAPWKYLPTLAVVARDIGGNALSASDGILLKDTTTRPTKIEQDIDVGISISPIHANRVRSIWSLEYRGISTASAEEDKMKRVHFGGELNVADLFFLRAGINQRYWTGGLEFASENTQVQLASYGEEIGTAASNREDRRYVLKFTFRF